MHFILIRHFPFGISLFSAFVPPAILAGHAGTDAATRRGGTPLADSSGGQSQRSARLQLSACCYITGPLGAVGTHIHTHYDTGSETDACSTPDARLGRRWSIGDSEGAIKEQPRSDRGSGGAIEEHEERSRSCEERSKSGRGEIDERVVRSVTTKERSRNSRGAIEEHK